MVAVAASPCFKQVENLQPNILEKKIKFSCSCARFSKILRIQEYCRAKDAFNIHITYE